MIRVHTASEEAEKLGSRFVAATHNTGLPTNRCLLNVKDAIVNRLFLMDKGAKVRVISSDQNNLATAQADTRRAANVTNIHTYGRHSLTLDLGLNRTFRWTSIFANDPCHIFGKDILQYFDLLVDAWRRKTVDRWASPNVRCWYAVNTQITPHYAELLAQQPDNEPRCSYPNALQHTSTISAVISKVPRHIKTKRSLNFI